MHSRISIERERESLMLVMQSPDFHQLQNLVNTVIDSGKSKPKRIKLPTLANIDNIVFLL